MLEELVSACIEAARSGVTFPEIWHSLLKPHIFVAGVPITRMEGNVALLEVPLITGQRIVVGPGATDFRVAAGKGENAVI